ncbi:MAG: phosphatidylserine decarboxylase [Candidatus Fermentibacteraceae bacterium]|nr:phosphatidylserine decarboxylase [Candidatus Fermentibacteraceae bacterium]
MKRAESIPSILMAIAIAAVAGVYSACGSQEEEISHQPVTLQLIELIESNAEVGELLEESIALAREANPDPETNPVQSLDDYYSFIDRASRSLPQDMIDCPPGLSMRDQMLQGICYFYFLVSQPLPELEDKGLFSNSIEYYEPFASWLRDFAVVQGQYMDTEESWGEEVYLEIYNDAEYGMQDDWYEDPSNWNTFNRFFSRYLSSPDVRPVASPDDAAVVVSPADCVPQGAWRINDDSEIEVEGGLTVKLQTFYSIHDLLKSDSEYRDAFAGGVLTHAFLNVSDYHRYHFAAGGEIVEKASLTRNVALEVSWDEEQGKYIPLDSTGWQFSQTLGYVIVDTDDFGLVALIPMGMAMVSSVNFEDCVAEGNTCEKGDMLGYFLFGGSDFIMLFQDEAGFEITAPMENETEYGHILMGEEYGRMGGVE